MSWKPRHSTQRDTVVATKAEGIEWHVALSVVIRNWLVGIAAILGAIATLLGVIKIPKALEGRAEAKATAQGTLDR